MNSRKRKVIAIALAITSLALLTGCGKSSDNPGPAPGVVPGTSTPGYGSGACVPINQQIPFTANNIYLSALQLKGGQIPYSQYTVPETYGTVVIGGGGTGPFTDSGVDGMITMNIAPLNATYNGVFMPGSLMAPATANASGVITIASATQQDIIYTNGGTTGTYPNNGTYPYNGYNGTIPCVSGLAIVSGFQGGYAMYGTKIFLYLNGTAHGYILEL